MTGKTHLLGGVLAGVCASTYMGYSDQLLNVIALMTVGGVGGLFPDIDTPTSKMGSKVKPLSWALSKTVGHRGMFHAPLLYVVLGVVLWRMEPIIRVLGLVFLAGCMSHLILDAMNVQGIPILWPVKSRLSLMQIKLDGAGECAIRVLNVAAICVILFWKPLAYIIPMQSWTNSVVSALPFLHL